MTFAAPSTRVCGRGDQPLGSRDRVPCGSTGAPFTFMTDEQMRVAIAEACGWKDPTCEVMDMQINPDGKLWTAIPDYPNDLNAMHEAIMAQPVKIRMSINDKLMHMLNPEAPYLLDKTINATARQRSEAFLRTLGKWTE
jgi:hypothetical protein